MGSVIAIAGVILLVIGGLVTTIQAFRESPPWGFASLFTGSLAYSIHCFKEDKKPLLTFIAAIAMIFLGNFIGEIGG